MQFCDADFLAMDCDARSRVASSSDWTAPLNVPAFGVVRAASGSLRIAPGHYTMNVDAALERMMDEEFAGATHDSDGDDDYLDAVKKPTFSPAVRADVKKTAEPAKAKGSLAERLAAKHNIKVTGAARPAATATAAPADGLPRPRRRQRLDRARVAAPHSTVRPAGGGADRRRRRPVAAARPYDDKPLVAARPLTRSRRSPHASRRRRWRRSMTRGPRARCRRRRPRRRRARPLLGGACGLLDAAPPSAPPAAPARAPSVGAYFGATQTAAPTAAAAAADPYAYGQRAYDAAPTGAAAGHHRFSAAMATPNAAFISADGTTFSARRYGMALCERPLHPNTGVHVLEITIGSVDASDLVGGGFVGVAAPAVARCKFPPGWCEARSRTPSTCRRCGRRR